MHAVLPGGQQSLAMLRVCASCLLRHLLLLLLLQTGRSVTLPSASDPLASQQYIAVAELLTGRDGCNDRITVGAGLPPAAINTYLPDEVCERTVVFWAAASKAVGAKRQRVLGSLVLSEQAVKVDDARALPVLIKVKEGRAAPVRRTLLARLSVEAGGAARGRWGGARLVAPSHHQHRCWEVGD